MTTAEDFKKKGNEEFSAKNFEAAIVSFTSAIELDGSNHVLFSNRSASHASLGNFAEALADAEKCVELKPDWAKGYTRLGAALHGLRRYDDAVAQLEKGKALDAGNATFDEMIMAAKRDKFAANDPIAKIFGPDIVARVQANPMLRPFLAQPDYVQMLNAVAAQPAMAKAFMKDQRFMQTFLALSGIDLSGMGGGGARDEDEGAAPTASKPPAAAPEQPKPEPAKPAAPAASAAGPASEAAKLKETGNALYKERRFDEALEQYQRAFDLEPTNTTFLLNMTAVHFEKGDFERCIAECEKALEHGLEHRCDYAVKGKLMTRQALCLQRLKRHEEAIPLFKKALVEHRNADTLAKLEACEKEKKKLDIEAYINPELAVKAKEEGNAHFKADRFPDAVRAYTEATKRNPSEHTAFSNRAAAYLKLGAYTEALEDCEKCLALCPTFVKAWARKGHAYFWTKQYNKAMQAYDEGLKLDADNAECQEGRQRTLAKIQETASGNAEDGDEAARRAMADPEIAAIMGDSYIQMVLREMQNDPQRMHEYMRDPGIAAKINKLITAGILRFGGKDAKEQPQQRGGRR